MKRALAAGVAALAVGLAATLHASPARAAFELRDASPAALGGVSIDLESESMFEAARLHRGGLRLGASHSALYQVEGLAQERAWIGGEWRWGSISITYSRVGVAGAAESSARVAIQESRASAVELELDAERLDLSIDGEAREGGMTLGGAARARASFPRFDLEVGVAADRILQSRGLDRLSVTPSVPIAVRLRSGSAAVGWVDRWGGDGRRSPRLVLDLPLGGSARLRLGRGELPGRTGAALAVRLRAMEVSAGRMDQSSGEVITGFAVGLVTARAGGGR